MQFKSLRLFFLVVLLLPAGLAAVTAARAEGPPMWRVEAGPTTFYFLGTFHLLTEAIEWMSPEIVAAFDASDNLVLELSPDQQSSGLIAYLISQKGYYKGGRTLKDELGEEEYLRLVEQASMLGFPEPMIRKFKPWYAAVALTVQFSQIHDFNPAYGVEIVLSREARNANKTVSGLESADEQLSALAELPMEIQVKMLSETLDELDSLPELWGSMITAWLNADLAALEDLMFQFLRTEPEVYNRLITERNRKWLGRIKPLMGSEESFLIAVGAAHLIGPDSLLRMMADEGFAVGRFHLETEPAEAEEPELGEAPD